MSESLLAFLLKECSNYPTSEFWDKRLRSTFGDEVDAVVAERFLQPLPVVPGKLVFPCRTQPSCEAAGREIVETGGKQWAVCTCDLDEQPHLVSHEDLLRYRFDVDALANALSSRNNLNGRVKQIDARLWFLGDRSVSGRSVAWTLGLVREDSECVSLLESLLARLPSTYTQIIVFATPMCVPPDDAVRLNGLGIFLHPVPLDSGLRVSVGELIAIPARKDGDTGSWPDDFFKDEDDTWLTARVLGDRFSIPNSRLKEWREKGCPDLDGQRFVARKVSGIGWTYFRAQVNQIANRRDDKGKIDAVSAIEARLRSASQLKRPQGDSDLLDSR